MSADAPDWKNGPEQVYPHSCITQRWHPLILYATSITQATACFTLATSDSNGTQGFVFLTLKCFSLVTQI